MRGGCLSSFGGLLFFRGRDIRPAADLLSFASPKESKQRKGDPTVCVPPLRCGQPAVLDSGGGPQNSLRSNSCGPDPASICAPRHIQKGGEKTGRRFARPQDQTQQPIPIPTAQSQPPRRCAPRWLGGRAKQRPVRYPSPSVSTAGCPVAQRRGRRQWGRLPGRDPASGSNPSAEFESREPSPQPSPGGRGSKAK